MLRGSRAVNGRADVGLFELLLMVFFDKSRREGRGLELGMVGEPGSFLTMIFGGALAPREDDGELCEAEGPLGLLLPFLCAVLWL